MCHSSAYAAVKDLLAEEEREQRAGKARATERRKRAGINRSASRSSPRTTELQSPKALLRVGGDDGAVFNDGGCSCRHVRTGVRPRHPRFRGYLFKKEVNQMKAQRVFGLLGNKLCVV